MIDTEIGSPPSPSIGTPSEMAIDGSGGADTAATRRALASSRSASARRRGETAIARAAASSGVRARSGARGATAFSPVSLAADGPSRRAVAQPSGSAASVAPIAATRRKDGCMGCSRSGWISEGNSTRRVKTRAIP
jgi:hypothetical protein